MYQVAGAGALGILAGRLEGDAEAALAAVRAQAVLAADGVELLGAQGLSVAPNLAKAML